MKSVATRCRARLVARAIALVVAVVFARDRVAGADAPAAPAARPSVSAPHGALPMNRQIATIDGWLGQKPTSLVPPGVAPSFWRVLVPKDNDPTPDRLALGRRLYFEPKLSRDGTVACATCHDTSRGLADRRAASEGIGGRVGHRNAPTTMNVAFFQTQFWDGRAASLEAQAKLPIVNPIEMGQPTGDAAAAAIAGDATYQAMFRAAYGRPVSYDDIARAIAVFERTLIFLDAPFDRFARGDAGAVSEDAKAGFALFHGKGRCAGCHQMSSSSPIGTDNRSHNVGVSARHQDFERLSKEAIVLLSQDESIHALDRLATETEVSELGRFVVTRNYAEIGAFKTPQVRNVGVTAPYMHDGSMATLWDVMDHYNKGGEANPYLDGGIEPLDLSEREIDQLVAFMFSLTDTRLAEENASELERQRRIAAERRPFRNRALSERKVLPFERRAEPKE